MFGWIYCRERRFLICLIAPEDRSPLVSGYLRTPLSVAELSSGALSSRASPLVDFSG